MTKLFCYLDNGEYSEGEGTFYIAADSIRAAAKVYENYIFSHDYWGDEIPPEHIIYSTIKKNLKNFKIIECPGILVDDYRKNCMFWDIYDNEYDKKYTDKNYYDNYASKNKNNY